MITYGGIGIIVIVALMFIFYIVNIIRSRKQNKSTFVLPELEEDDDFSDGFNIDKKATSIYSVSDRQETKLLNKFDVETTDAPIDEVLTALDRVTQKKKPAINKKALPAAGLEVTYVQGAQVSSKKSDKDENFDSFLEDLSNEY